MHQVAYGQLDDLAALGTWDIRHLDHLGRDMARRGVASHLGADPVDQRLIQPQAFTQSHEQHDTHIVVPALADDQAFEHLIDLLDLAVDLRGTNTHATGIEHRIRASIDDDPIVRSELDKVTVTPDTGKALEIGGTVSGAIGVIPESERHARERCSAHQFALFLPNRVTVLVEHLDPHAQPAALQFSTPDRQHHAAQCKARDDVSAAGDRRQTDISLDLAVDVVEAFRCERRARRQDGLQRVQSVRLARPQL